MPWGGTEGCPEGVWHKIFILILYSPARFAREIYKDGLYKSKYA